jgi:hypothetical protein
LRFIVVSLQEPELQGDDGQRHGHEDDHLGLRGVDVTDGVGAGEDVVHHQVRGAIRAALGQDLHGREDEQVRDRVGDQDEGQRPAHQGQGDRPQPAGAAHTIKGGGLVDLVGDLVDASDQEQHPVADPDPGQQDHDRGQGLGRRGQEGLRGQAEPLKRGVGQPVRSVDDTPHDRRDGRRDGDG